VSFERVAASAASPKRGDLLPDRFGQRGDLGVEEVEVGEDRPDPDDVQVIEAALERLAQRRKLGAQAALGEIGEQLGVVPATSASSIARPEAPRMSVATQSSLIPESSSALCRRLASRARSWIWVLR
jgi:hypothetical protein